MVDQESRATLMDEPDLKELASSLGYCWPEDEIGQRRVLIQMAKRAAYWREQVSECQRGILREKWYAHISRRCEALAKKIKRIRESAIEYKRGRDFDALVKSKEQEII